ncbi:hypothetical protein IG631_04762 [Alternaria alternata]|nr:hypothetical protein IG631_04762 [Alternaria alternata]
MLYGVTVSNPVSTVPLGPEGNAHASTSGYLSLSQACYSVSSGVSSSFGYMDPSSILKNHLESSTSSSLETHWLTFCDFSGS